MKCIVRGKRLQQYSMQDLLEIIGIQKGKNGLIIPGHYLDNTRKHNPLYLENHKTFSSIIKFIVDKGKCIGCLKSNRRDKKMVNKKWKKMLCKKCYFQVVKLYEKKEVEDQTRSLTRTGETHCKEVQSQLSASCEKQILIKMGQKQIYLKEELKEMEQESNFRKNSKFDQVSKYLERRSWLFKHLQFLNKLRVEEKELRKGEIQQNQIKE